MRSISGFIHPDVPTSQLEPLVRMGHGQLEKKAVNRGDIWNSQPEPRACEWDMDR